MTPIALLNGPFYHHIDHLAPLSSLLNCPLLLDDKNCYSLTKKYYPNVNVQLDPICLEEVSHNYNLLLLSTKYASLDIDKIYKSLNKTHMRYCFCPHGLSDKGEINPLVDCYENQDIALLYGKKQETKLKNKKNSANTFYTIGNYRAYYYETHKQILDQHADTEIFSTLPNQQTILYAPTWNDGESSVTFFSNYQSLIDQLPSSFNLVIKLHPLLEKHHPGQAWKALSQDLIKPNVRVLLDFPLIYPVLNKIDIYLGDYSSIGYDFLYFNRPMFFLGDNNSSLQTCGRKVSSLKEFFKYIQDPQTSKQPIRKTTYNTSFAPYNHLKFNHRI